MKVIGPAPISQSGAARRTAKADDRKTGFARLLDDALEPEETQGLGLSAGISSVDALLAAQTVPDATDGQARRRRMAKRGEDILDSLEEIRVGLILGQVPKERLVALARVVRAGREQIDDPRLAAVLDEIELRAEVELAKLTRRP
ncbi:MAG: flagellar assembly protein FliX [Rhodospirillales bacterium]|nr:flagellar assembly protein FliX [Rhodospirillales bacterium]